MYKIWKNSIIQYYKNYKLRWENSWIRRYRIILEMKTNLEGTQEWKTHHKIYSDKKRIKRQKIFKVKTKEVNMILDQCLLKIKKTEPADNGQLWKRK